MVNLKPYISYKEKSLKKQSKEFDNLKVTIVQVGNNKADSSYLKGIKNTLSKFYIDSRTFYISNQEKMDCIEENYNCILLLDSDRILKDYELPKEKNVDNNCTVNGVLNYLKWKNVDIPNSNICLIGYGKLINRPMYEELIKLNCKNINVCRSKTTLEEEIRLCKLSDIIISAVGKRNTIIPKMVNKDTLILDCGISFDSLGKIHGDCSDELYIGGYNCTSIKRGNNISALTRLELMQNIIDIRKRCR